MHRDPSTPHSSPPASLTTANTSSSGPHGSSGADINTDVTQWRSLGAAIATISAVGAAIGLGIPLLSILLETRGFSASVIGANTATAGLASLFGAALSARIGARFGIARSMVVMLLISGLSFLGFYAFPHIYAWFALRVSLHFALTVLFVLSEYWVNTSAPPEKRGLILGIYATCLSLGFAIGPWLFSRIGSGGFMPFGVGFVIIMLALIPVLIARKDSPEFEEGEHVPFLPYIFIVPTATMAVFVYGAVETGGFALFPVFGGRVGLNEGDAALLLTMVGLGNVMMQIPLGLISDRIRDRRILLLICAVIGMAGMLLLPYVVTNWYLMAFLLLIWGGVVAGLYTVGLAHLGSQLTGRELASANAAFIFCYGMGMLAGPQAAGIGMDILGVNGFPITLAVFFAAFIIIVTFRLVVRKQRG